jgi:hypothetical protein
MRERQNFGNDELLCLQEEEDEGEFEEAVKQVRLFSLFVAESYSFFYHTILLGMINKKTNILYYK